MDIKAKDIENIKIAMVRKYGSVNFKRLAEEIGISRQSIYNAIENKPYTENVKIKLKEWLLENA